MGETMKLGIILLIITATAGFLLGGAHEITKEPIAIQNQKIQEEAMKEILPMASSFIEEIKPPENSIIESVSTGYADSQVAGFAVKLSPKGYGGAIEMMVGISSDGIIQGIKILSHAETPGLGANAQNESFSAQFKEKPSDADLTVIKGTAQNPSEIEAITGATITSRAVTDGVNTVIKLYHDELQNIGGVQK